MSEKIEKPEFGGMSQYSTLESAKITSIALDNMNNWLKSLCENELSEDILWRDYCIDNPKSDKSILEFIAKRIKEVLKV